LVPDLQSREISVRIGKTMHVMEMEHYIKYIDVYLDDNYVTRFFVHTQIMPAISIYMKPQGKNVRAVEWCTIHGYWQAEAAIS
jgi:desulfoferrodoxin-like iron-binding protein